MSTESFINTTAAFSEIDRLTGTSPAQAKQAVEAKASPETAKIEYSQEGVCPYCQKAMVRSFAAGQPIHLCRDDRYVAPMSNDVLAKIEAEGTMTGFQFSA